MQRIKDSGKAGVIAYALTEGAFWIGSVPFAIAAVTLATVRATRPRRCGRTRAMRAG